MATFDVTDRFRKDYAGLSDTAKARFREAVAKFVADLNSPDRLRATFGVRAIRKRPGTFEFHFEGNGRASFEYGAEVRVGEPHVVWRRIGTHDIYDDP